MKRIIETEQSALESLLGKTVTLLCLNYFYTGVLSGVNDHDVAIKDPKIVYETGAWDSNDWADAQKLPCEEVYVRIAAIEAYGVLK